jgi:hypothetical protein
MFPCFICLYSHRVTTELQLVIVIIIIILIEHTPAIHRDEECMEHYFHAQINYVFMKTALFRLFTLHLELYSQNSFTDARNDPS